MVRRHLATAAAVLAAAGACANQPATTNLHAGPAVAHEVPHADHRRPHVADPAAGLAENLATIPARPTTPRVARNRPRPAPVPPAPRPAGTGDIWAALARCESGGNARAVSASGTYRGAFQFSLATWRSVGMVGDPIDHSYGEQLAAAQRLQARSGWSQWPACSRKIGVR